MAKEDKSFLTEMLSASLEGSGIKAIGNILLEGLKSPEVSAALRLGWKETGNIFDMSRDGSVGQSSYEYGMPGSKTPGAIDRGKDGEGLAPDGKFDLFGACVVKEGEAAIEAQKSQEAQKEQGMER